MSEHPDDRDPAPLEHSDAERVTPEEADKVPDSEQSGGSAADPAHDPTQGPLRDGKGS